MNERIKDKLGYLGNYWDFSIDNNCNIFVCKKGGRKRGRKRFK